MSIAQGIPEVLLSILLDGQVWYPVKVRHDICDSYLRATLCGNPSLQKQHPRFPEEKVYLCSQSLTSGGLPQYQQGHCNCGHQLLLNIRINL